MKINQFGFQLYVAKKIPSVNFISSPHEFNDCLGGICLENFDINTDAHLSVSSKENSVILINFADFNLQNY